MHGCRSSVLSIPSLSGQMGALDGRREQFPALGDHSRITEFEFESGSNNN